MANRGSAARNVSNAKAKLNKFSSDLNQDDLLGIEYTSASPIKTTKAHKIVTDENWRSALIGCGSNAFHQLNLGSFDLMTPTMKSVQFYNSSNKKLNHEVLSISSKGNLTLVSLNEENSVNNTCYIWGDGLPSGPLKIPAFVPLQHQVLSVSCGHSHAGLISTEGKAFTWGSGEFGMTGLGIKHHVPTPREVPALKNMKTVSISCGAYHTAFISDSPDCIQEIELPVDNDKAAYAPCSTDYSKPNNPGASRKQQWSRIRQMEESFVSSGNLYVCGQSKAGQLGLGAPTSSGTTSSSSSNGGFVQTPTRVDFFDQEGLAVVAVSCGFHHTLVIAIPKSCFPPNYQPFFSQLYSFGWGDQGRLGVGDEEPRFTPTLVNFPHPFLPTHISAGDQHSLALSIVSEGAIRSAIPRFQSISFSSSILSSSSALPLAYSWGSNGQGQLGVGQNIPLSASHPQQTTSTTTPSHHHGFPSLANNSNNSGSGELFACIPLPILIPQSMKIKQIAAGGRHSAAITTCGKLLCWGWGEEGQLGSGQERNSNFPRPAKLPRSIRGRRIAPVAISLGTSHTLVLVENLDYRLVEPTPSPVIESPPLFNQPKPPRSPVISIEPVKVATPSPSPSPPPPPSSMDPLDGMVEYEIEDNKRKGLLLLEEEESAMEKEEEEEEPKDGILETRMETEIQEEISVEPIEPILTLEVPPRMEFLSPVRSIRELLQLREERISQRDGLSLVSPPKPPSPHEDPTPIPDADPVEVEEELMPEVKEAIDLFSAMSIEVNQEVATTGIEEEEEEEVAEEIPIEENIIKESLLLPPPQVMKSRQPSNNKDRYQFFYKDGQNLDDCKVANSAKRAEIRRIRKSQSHSQSQKK